MDPNPYPATGPAPAPPGGPVQTPPPPTGYYGPGEPPPKKKKTALIIAIVVIVLLLCCCVAGAGGALFIARSESDSGTIDFEWPPTDTPGEPADVAPGSTASADSGWDDFDPGAYDTSVYVAPTSRQAALAEEINDTLYPDFVIDEVLCMPGYTDDDTYWDDEINILASLSGNPDARIAYVIYAQTEEAWADGASYDPDEIEEFLTLGFAEDGTEYLYSHESFAGFLGGVSDPDALDLLVQATMDLKGSVADTVAVEDNTGYIALTSWDAYLPYSGGFNLTYTRTDDVWQYASSEPW
jgi:hypothetical protein